MCLSISSFYFNIHINYACFVKYVATIFFKSYDDILEPKLDELIGQLREIGGLLDQRLTFKLSSLVSPDDLFNSFGELQGERSSFQFLFFIFTFVTWSIIFSKGLLLLVQFDLWKWKLCNLNTWCKSFQASWGARTLVFWKMIRLLWTLAATLDCFYVDVYLHLMYYHLRYFLILIHYQASSKRWEYLILLLEICIKTNTMQFTCFDIFTPWCLFKK